MSTTRSLGTLIIIAFAFIAIVVSILELAGVVGTAGWLGSRIPALTLIIVGVLSVFLVVETSSSLRYMQMGAQDQLRRLEMFSDRQGAILEATLRDLQRQLRDPKTPRVSYPDRIRFQGVDALPPLNSMHVVVYADVDEDSEAWQRLSAASVTLAESLGYTLERQFPVEYGSVFQRGFWKRVVTADEARYLEATLQQALGLKIATLNQAEVDSKQAAAAATVITALASIPTACVKVGSVLVLKYPVAPGGDSVLLVRTLSAREVQLIDRYPAILRNPPTALDALTMAMASEEVSGASAAEPGLE